MPPFSEDSEQVIRGLLEQYNQHISGMRHGREIGQGPFLLGEATDAEAQKFMDLADRRYPVMTGPSRQESNSLVTVWLTGDPSYVHEELACIFSHKLATFAEDQRSHLDASTLCSLSHVLHHTVQSIGSPRVSITVLDDGYVKNRKFCPGQAIKEPDAMFHTSAKIPLQYAQNFCAIEVAFGNEDIAGLLFEGCLWSQRASADTLKRHPSAQAQRQALNFAGIHVGRHEKDVASAAIFKFSFAVLVVPSVCSRKSAEVVLLNASTEYAQAWKKETEQSALGRIPVRHADEVCFEYTYFCTFLEQIQAFRGLQFAITFQDLVRHVLLAERLEDNCHQSHITQQTPTFDLKAHFGL
ncbi:unnamed protein product [Sympodiomycopsis kandeliae]